MSRRTARGLSTVRRATPPPILSGQGRLAAINDVRAGRDRAALFAAIAPDAWRRFSPSGRAPIGARRIWRLHLALVDALRPLAPMLDEHDLQREADQDLTAFLDEMNDQDDDQEVLAGDGWRILGEWQFQPHWYYTVPLRVGAYHYGVVYNDDVHPSLEDALGLLVNRHIASYGHRDMLDKSGRSLDTRLAADLPQPLGEALYALIDPMPEEPCRTTPGVPKGHASGDPFRRYVDAVDAWSARFDRRAAGVVRALAGEHARGGLMVPDLALFARWVAFDADLAGEFTARTTRDASSDADSCSAIARAGEDNPYLLDPDETSLWDIDYDWDEASLRALLAHAARAHHLYRRMGDVRAALGSGGDPAMRVSVARALLAALARADAGWDAAAIDPGVAGVGRGGIAMDARQVALVYARYLPGRWAELRRGYRAATDAAGVVAERRGLYRALVDDDALPLAPEEELIERLTEDEDDGDEPPIGPDGRLSPGAAWWTRVVPVRNDLASYGCEPPSSWAETVLAGLYATWADYSCSHDADWPAPPPTEGWDPTDAGARLLARGRALRRTGHRPDESVARVEAAWSARVDPRGPLRDLPAALRYMAGATGSEYLDLGDDWGEMGYADRPWSWCVWVDIFQEWDQARAYLARSRAALHALTDPSVGAEAVRLVEAALAFDDAGDMDGVGDAHYQGDRVDWEGQ